MPIVNTIIQIFICLAGALNPACRYAVYPDLPGPPKTSLPNRIVLPLILEMSAKPRHFEQQRRNVALTPMTFENSGRDCAVGLKRIVILLLLLIFIPLFNSFYIT